jgi:hypothetical protein
MNYETILLHFRKFGDIVSCTQGLVPQYCTLIRHDSPVRSQGELALEMAERKK